MISSRTGEPANYAELYEHYFDMMRHIVSKAGIRSEDVEDVTCEILLKFMEKDALAWYDPEKLHDIGESPRIPGERFRPAKFSNLLRRFTELYVRQYLDKQRLRDRREPSHARLDAPMTTVDGSGSETTWGEAHSHLLHTSTPMETEVDMSVWLDSLVSNAWQEADEVADVSGQERAWRERRRAAEGLAAAVDMAERGIRVTGPALATACGWSSSMGRSVLRGVRKELRAAWPQEQASGF